MRAALDLLIQAGCDVNAADKNGYTPAHFLAHGGHVAALELLIDAGCDVNAADDLDGNTPAYLAALEGHAAALELLIKAGCTFHYGGEDGREASQSRSRAMSL